MRIQVASIPPAAAGQMLSMLINAMTTGSKDLGALCPNPFGQQPACIGMTDFLGWYDALAS